MNTMHADRAPRLVRAALALSLLSCGDSADDKSRPAGEPMPEGALPEQPETFRVELSGSACYGSCPTYSASIDQDGKVHFVGESCTARPGVFEHEVAPETARALYRALLESPYPELKDRYVDRNDGCNPATDHPTYTWDVTADDRTKPLVRYAGCMDIAEEELAEVDALMPVFHEDAQVEHLLDPNQIGCAYDSVRSYPVELRLERAGQPLGMLRITPDQPTYTFTFDTCSGDPIAHGNVRSDGARWLLIDIREVPIELPALGDVGSLILDFPREHSYADQRVPIRGVRAIREREDLELEFTEADSCAQ